MQNLKAVNGTRITIILLAALLSLPATVEARGGRGGGGGFRGGGGGGFRGGGGFSSGGFSGGSVRYSSGRSFSGSYGATGGSRGFVHQGPNGGVVVGGGSAVRGAYGGGAARGGVIARGPNGNVVAAGGSAVRGAYGGVAARGGVVARGAGGAVARLARRRARCCLWSPHLLRMEQHVVRPQRGGWHDILRACGSALAGLPHRTSRGSGGSQYQRRYVLFRERGLLLAPRYERPDSLRGRPTAVGTERGAA
jgi:hypothetical protein